MMIRSCLKYEQAFVWASARGIYEVILTEPNMAARGYAKNRLVGAAGQAESWWSDLVDSIHWRQLILML